MRVLLVRRHCRLELVDRRAGLGVLRGFPGFCGGLCSGSLGVFRVDRAFAAFSGGIGPTQTLIQPEPAARCQGTGVVDEPSLLLVPDREREGRREAE